MKSASNSTKPAAPALRVGIQEADFRHNGPDALVVAFGVASDTIEAARVATGEMKAVRAELAADRKHLANLTRQIETLSATRAEQQTRAFIAFAVSFLFVGAVVGIIIGRAIS